MTEPARTERIGHPLAPWQPTFRVSQLRAIAAIMAGYQTLTVYGLGMFSAPDVPFVGIAVGGLATFIALVLTICFTIDARRCKPITHTEEWRVVLLAMNPLWPGFLIALAPSTRIQDPSLSQSVCSR
ncbi:MAG: hypothetical protein AB8F26_07320 [Phycisphaerales bacterium]